MGAEDETTMFAAQARQSKDFLIPDVIPEGEYNFKLFNLCEPNREDHTLSCRRNKYKNFQPRILINMIIYE